jgi:hypothetical protein
MWVVTRDRVTRVIDIVALLRGYTFEEEYCIDLDFKPPGSYFEDM